MKVPDCLKELHEKMYGNQMSKISNPAYVIPEKTGKDADSKEN
jgi:hypothetical protein